MSERIAKRIAAAGIASRRGAEELILAGRVRLNGKLQNSPACTVTDEDVIEVDGKTISKPERVRLFCYHKPLNLLCTHKDPQGRPTVFDMLPSTLPRLVSVGRLDINSEGLLLLTTDGALAGTLGHPDAGLKRVYRARVLGLPTDAMIARLAKGITVEGVRYRPIEMTVADAKKTGSRNKWVQVTVAEGKNREVRKALEAVGLSVNRLIRVSYGPFELGDLPKGMIKEVPYNRVKKLITEYL